MEEKRTILIIEDDADISQLLYTALSKAGYNAVQAYSGTEGVGTDICCFDGYVSFGLHGEAAFSGNGGAYIPGGAVMAVVIPVPCGGRVFFDCGGSHGYVPSGFHGYISR